MAHCAFAMTRSAARPAAGPIPGFCRRAGVSRLQAGAAVLSALIGGAALLANPSRVEAHAIESSITRLASLSNGLLLSSQFGSGQPTVAAKVRLIAPDGAAIELGRTDGQGQLSFALPKGASGDWDVQVDGGPGHRDYLTVPVQAGMAQLDRLSGRELPGLGDSLATLLHPGVLALGGLCGVAGVVIGLDRRRRRG